MTSVPTPDEFIRHEDVAASASEAELGALFSNMKEGLILRQTLKDIRRPQPATPVQTDNSTASGIANNAIKQNKSRSMDMRYHWVRDKVQQGLFNVYWDKGSRNKADYYTKHHSPSHHQLMRPQYLYCNAALATLSHQIHRALRGCVDPMPTSSGSDNTRARQPLH